MDSPDGGDRPDADEANSDALRRMRLAIADATFVAEGLTLDLLLKWAGRAPPFDDLPPRVLARRAPDDGVRVPPGH